MINWSVTQDLASLLTLKNNYKFCFIKMIVINSGYFKNELFSLIAIGESKYSASISYICFMGLFMLALRPECSLKSEDLSECKLFINLEANPGSGTAPSVELRGRDLGDEGGLGKLKWTSLMAAGEGMGEASGVEQTEDSCIGK